MYPPKTCPIIQNLEKCRFYKNIENVTISPRTPQHPITTTTVPPRKNKTVFTPTNGGSKIKS
jgi:hypothetical protein